MNTLSHITKLVSTVLTKPRRKLLSDSEALDREGFMIHAVACKDDYMYTSCFYVWKVVSCLEGEQRKGCFKTQYSGKHVELINTDKIV
jgi:hypothetical protein